ncbi:MAG: hypothetical protein IPO16_08860 [Saprospiraceae bacterium]|nr:hypothetical protein [Saprospiraceae bacterium]
MAQTNLNQFKQLKDKLMPLINPEDKCNDEVLHIYFDFYGVSCSVFLFLAMSLETTMNLIIDDYIKISILNKKEIRDLYFSKFKNKIKNVVPRLSKLNYFKTYPNDFFIFSKLIDMRNNIAHSKPENGITNYDVILNNVFNFKYDLTFETVAKYINFHRKGLITECDCSNDY